MSAKSQSGSPFDYALTRRTLLGLVGLSPLAYGADSVAQSVTRYLQSLSRPDGGYGWADEPDSSVTTSFAALRCYRVLGQEAPRKTELARFVRDNYPMPEGRRKDRPLHHFDFEQIQTLVWLGEPLDDFSKWAVDWNKPSYFTKTYEMNENPLLKQETGAVLGRHLLGLPATGEWKQYIASRRRPNGSFNHTPGNDGSEGHVTNTLWGLLAMEALGVPIDRKAETVAWLQSCQQRGGGFTYAPSPAIAPVDHVDYTWAALSALKKLGASPKDSDAARRYLLSLANQDGGFGDQPRRASNPVATAQALEALSCLAPVAEWPPMPAGSVARPAALPANLKVFTIQIQAPGTGSPREAAEMAAALKIDLWGAKNTKEGWLSRAQQLAGEGRLPVTFFEADEEYGTYVQVPGLGTYSHLADVTAPAGSSFGAPLADKDKQPNSWQSFLDKRIAPLQKAGGSNVWQFNENEELTRVLLNQAVRDRTFSAISSFHFGNENFLKSQPFLNTYRDVMPFIGLQDAHTQTWWWMEFLVGFRTLFLAAEPTWAAWQNALKQNWIVSVRHDSRTGFKTELAGGSSVVRQYILDRQAHWKWWGEQPDQLIRPMASLVAVKPDEQFEEARPQEGVMLRLRPWWDTKPFGVPAIPVVELVTLEVDGAAVQPKLVQIPQKGADRGDVYYQWPVAPDRKGMHTAVATVRHSKSGATSKVTRQFTV